MRGKRNHRNRPAVAWSIPAVELPAPDGPALVVRPPGWFQMIERPGETFNYYSSDVTRRPVLARETGVR